MKEAPIHSAAVEQAHGAGVAIGQNGFGPVFGRNRFQPGGDSIQRFIPGDPLKFACAFRVRCVSGDKAAGQRNTRAPDTAQLFRIGIRG